MARTIGLSVVAVTVAVYAGPLLTLGYVHDAVALEHGAASKIRGAVLEACKCKTSTGAPNCTDCQKTDPDESKKCVNSETLNTCKTGTPSQECDPTSGSADCGAGEIWDNNEDCSGTRTGQNWFLLTSNGGGGSMLSDAAKEFVKQGRREAVVLMWPEDRVVRREFG